MICRCYTILVDGLPVHYFGEPPEKMTKETREAMTAMVRSIRLDSIGRDHAQPCH